MDRRTLGKGLLGLGLTGAIGGASGCSSDGSDESGSGGSKVLTLALDTDPGSLDPAKLVSGSSSVQLWQGVFDTLLRYQPDGSIVPNAAESYTFNDDKTELILKIRSGMTFTDGSLVDAEAVKSSLEWMRSGSGSDATRLADVTVTAADSSTVVLTTPEAKGLLPTFLCLAPGALSSPASHSASDIDTNPTGSGPYTLDLSGTTSGDTWTLVRNEDYWNREAFPYDTVVLRLMGDITARINALKSGQITAAPITSQTKDEAQSSGLTVLENPVNWAGLMLGDPGGTVIPALGDRRVRQAINMIFDREAIVTNLYQGNAEVTNQIFNSDSEAFLPDLVDYYPYDLDRARTLMQEAGYPDGFTFDLPAITGMDTANPMIVQQFKEINVTANQVTIAGNQAIGTILSGQYPIFYMTLESRTALWDIVQSLLPDSIWNLAKYDDPTLRPMLDLSQTLTGEEAAENAREINQYIVEEAWFCPWALPTNFYAMDRSVTATAFLGSVVPYLFSFTPA